ncbi:MAG: ATP phosphoribosyltransferase [Myxococcota bacterium]
MNEDGQTILRLGLPKGRMEQGTLRLLEDAGIQVRVSSRGYRPWLSLPGADAKVLKPQNIIEMVRAGSRHVGFAGADWVAELGYEHDSNLVELLDTGLDKVRVVVAAPERNLRDGKLHVPPGKTLVVASELPRLAQRWIEQKGVQAKVLRTYGATEVFPPDDADAIVDIAATGDTLKANKLEVVDEVLTSSTRLYGHGPSLLKPEVRARVDELVLLLGAALEARHRAMVDLNVARNQLEAVLEVLPSLRQPTISDLRNEDGFAVRSAVPREQLTTLIPELKRAGAEDIVVTTPTQLVR